MEILEGVTNQLQDSVNIQASSEGILTFLVNDILDFAQI